MMSSIIFRISRHLAIARVYWSVQITSKPYTNHAFANDINQDATLGTTSCSISHTINRSLFGQLYNK